jgi:hypothetical protein
LQMNRETAEEMTNPAARKMTFSNDKAIMVLWIRLLRH